MASPNLDLVRSIYAAWERGDFSSTEWADASIEWVTADGPAPGAWRGVAGMRGASRDWVNAWEDYRVQAYEYRELGDERILVLFRYSGRGKVSGLELGELAMNGAGVFDVRDAKVTRLVAYWDRDRALADLGLAPDDG
jgi:ketosteroid isomerase-like protein